MFLRSLRTLLASGLLLSWAAVGHTAPVAGVMINNTAQATYVDATSGTAVHLNSNTVSTRVTALEALTLASNQSVTLATGAPFTISHTLTNTGNTDSTYQVTVAADAGSSFAPLNLQVVRDANGNGRVDAGEPVVGSAGIAVPRGTSVNLLVVGQVPPSAGTGQQGKLVLTAVSQAQGAKSSNTDTLVLTNGAALQVLLSASVGSGAAAAPSVPLDWTVVAVNNGSSAAAAQAVTIDGAAASVFVVRAPVPANTRFTSATPSANVGARLLYHALGAPSGSYLSVAPAASQVDAVAWALNELPPGGSLQGQFRTTVNANAAGTISDTAYADWSDSGAAQLTTSNTVQLPLPGRAAALTFFTSGTYATTALQNSPGNPLYVQADAAQCNAEPARADSVTVKVTSQLTGDVESFTAIETSPNSGVFRIQPDVPTANANTHAVAAGDGILEVLRNDVVTATIDSCNGASASAQTKLLIDPSGVVYDSHTNQPVAGATVELVDVSGAGNGGRPGAAASVLQLDGVTPAPATVKTGADGAYTFPLVEPGTYQIRVTPPNGLVFPSAVPAAMQPVNRLIDTQGSFGGSFRVAAGAVHFDIPLDTGGRSGLFVQKTASKATAEIGDFVDYTVTVKNVTAVMVSGVQVRDALPTGFGYVRGTARLDGAAIADPAGGIGPQIAFPVGAIAPGSQRVVSYRVRVGVNAQRGNGTNTARASAGALVSNLASVHVDVLGGVFADDAYIIGKVFADCRRDGVQSGGEPGIPGVRIYLEDGTYAVTDEEGKYSLYGLTPRAHVVKVDPITLPAGAQLVVLDNRNAFDAGSRFADLKNGELHKADFAVGGCDASLREQIEARRKALANPSEIEQAAGVLLQANAQVSGLDARTLPASGAMGLPGSNAASGSAIANPAAPLPGVPGLGAVADTGGSVGASLQGLPKPLFRRAQTQADAGAASPTEAAVPQETAPLVPLEDLLSDFTPATAFVGLVDGQQLPSAQTRVRVKGPLGATFELTVNGEPVPAKRVGKRASLQQKGTTAWEYIGVDLKPGRNTLAVQARDPFGNVRGSAELTVLAPGALAKIGIDLPEKPVADADTPIAVTVRLQDAEGLAIVARTQLTLQASAGEWQLADADPHQAGTQVMVEGGTGRFLLLPPANPGKVQVTVLAGTVKASTDVEFVPKLRPLLAAGIVEGTINLRNLSPSALQPTQSGDVFEREIESASRSFGNGRDDAGARAALFLKGKVLGSSLLTLAYDSDKPSDTRLFRDIQPNQFYPVYGDSSARGFDAQSTGKLYVLLQNGSNYALLGDFSTQSDNPARQLTQYSRALNGGKAHWSAGRFSGEAFGSRTSATQVVQEIRANGTSGPFQLDVDGVANSEQVHVIVRSRSQPALVLKDTVLTQFADYAIEPTTGLLLLKDPVPSLDADLNPVFVRITYDVDTGGPRHFVGGAEGNVQVAPGTTVGAVAVTDDDPTNRQRIEGLTLTSKLGETTVLTGELARTHTDLQGQGQGQRLEFKHQGANLQAHVWGAHTDAGFYNPISPQSAGQSQYGAKVGYNLDARNRIVGEALKTTDGVTGAEQAGAELKLEHSLPGNAKIEVGVRHSDANAQAAGSIVAAPGTSFTPAVTTVAGTSTGPVAYTSARAKLTVPVPGVPQADVYGQAEESFAGTPGREIGVGADYAISAGTKVYARHDFINSLGGTYTLNTDVSQYNTVVGVNTTVADNTQLFNEYRVGDGVDGRTSEAAVGVRKSVKLANGLNVNGSLQRVKPVTGPATDDSDAIALGADYTGAKDWKASGQVQWQTSATSRSWLFSGALVNKLGPEWTLLHRFLYSDQVNAGSAAGARELVDVQSGLAYRPVDNDVWNALGRIEYKRDDDSTTVVQATDEGAWILSTHLNVQPNHGFNIAARYAAKLARDRANGLDTTSFTQLLGGRATWDLNEHWDLGLQAYVNWGNGVRDQALGVELGYLLWKNLWLSVGYNFKGFSARDLAGDANTQRGAYLRLRFKFDEALFDRTAGADAAPQKKNDAPQP